MTTTPATEINTSAMPDWMRTKYEDLRAKLARASDDYDFWRDVLDSNQYKNLSAEWEKQIQSCRTALETAKSEDVKRLQAEIRAMKELIKQLEGLGSVDGMDAARKAMDEFEAANALFLHGDPYSGCEKFAFVNGSILQVSQLPNEKFAVGTFDAFANFEKHRGAGLKATYNNYVDAVGALRIYARKGQLTPIQEEPLPAGTDVQDVFNGQDEAEAEES